MDRHTLGLLEPIEVAEALRVPIEASGRTISSEGLEAAVSMSARYPFLVQLVGYHVWRNRPDRTQIGVDSNYANHYRARLLDAEMIVTPRRGYVDFELPYLREHLRERNVGSDLD